MTGVTRAAGLLAELAVNVGADFINNDRMPGMGAAAGGTTIEVSFEEALTVAIAVGAAKFVTIGGTAGREEEVLSMT